MTRLHRQRSLPRQARPPTEARTAILAIIIVSSLAFLLFELRRDVVRTMAMAEARLALQGALVQNAPGGPLRTATVLDGPDHVWRQELGASLPALTGQLTVAVPLSLEAQSREAFLRRLAIPDLPTDDTRGRFTIVRARLFASLRSGSTTVLTSVPLSALRAGLAGRMAIDFAVVGFLGLLLLLVRESRLSDYSVRRLLDASPVPLFLIDAEGKFDFANRTALDLFEQSGTPTLDGFRAKINEHREFSSWLTDSSASDKNVSAREFEIRESDTTRYLLASRQTFVVRSQPMTIASVNDISVHHEAELALNRAKEAAESLGRMKSELLAMISHELRTPVNGVLGLSQLLAAQQLPEGPARIVDRMIQAGRTLAVLVNDVVDLAMLETGHFRLNQEKFNLQEAIIGAVSLASAVPSQQEVKVRVTFDAPLPTNISGDPARLRQIMLNLVGNSIKFTKDGSIEVRTSVQRDREPAILVIEVIDTGIGIPADMIPKLFQPFSQVESGHRRRFEGTGLGLAISKRLIVAMGGDITLRSTEGSGSTFRVSLPLDLHDEEISEDRPRVLLTRGLRVLVVDDMQINRDVVAQLLAAEHCVVTNAASGEEAIALCREIDFDLVLMDIRMPGMDGLSATAAIRADTNFHRARIPILGLTANPLPTDRPLFALRGIDGVLEKPVEREHLRAALVRYAEPEPVSTTIIPPRLKRLRQDLGPERSNRIVQMFLSAADEAAEAIADGCSLLDFDRIMEAAHRLSGSSANTGFEDLSATSGHLETLAKAQDAQNISSAALDAIQHLKKAHAVARLWRSQSDEIGASQQTYNPHREPS